MKIEHAARARELEIEAREDELDAQVTAIRSHYVEYARLKKIKSDLNWLLKRDNKASEGAGLLLIGQSGSGKTKVIEEFISHHPRQYLALTDEQGNKADFAPVVLANVPDATLKGFNGRLYHVFTGRSPPKSMDRMTRQDAVLHYARVMKTKLLILEEAHQAIDSKSDRVANDVGSFMKDLLNQAQFSIVIVGTYEARRLVEASAELSRRILKTHELRPFDWCVPSERRDFKDVLKTFDARFEEIFGVSTGLYKAEMAFRIYQATEGIIGQVARLLEAAGHLAVHEAARDPSVGLTTMHLREAYEGAAIRKNGHNPFDDLPAPAEIIASKPAGERRPKSRKSNVDAQFRR